MPTSMTSRNQLLLMVLGLGLLAAAGFAASRLLPLGEWLEALVTWAAEVGPLGAILVGLLYIPVCILVLPATLLTYTLALAFGLWPAFLATVLGATLGASAVFLLGRHLARDLVAKNAERYPLLAALDSVLDEKSFGMIVLVRLSPLFPFSVVGYALGATRIGFWRHLFATAIAILPQTFLTCYVVAGLADLSRELGAERERGPWELAMFGLGIVAAVVVLVAISRRTRAALQARLERAAS